MSEDNKPFTVSDRRHFTADGGVREETAPATQPAEGPGDAEEGGKVDFTSFLMSLGVQAHALLAAADKPEEDAPHALKGAQSIISILEMLQDKTEGRRDDNESRILESLLFELRMSYVAAARAVKR